MPAKPLCYVVNPPKVTTYTNRAFTDTGADNFIADLHNQSWQPVYDAETSDAKAEVFANIVDQLLEKHFKWKTVVRKEGEAPWIIDTIRRL